MRLIGMAERALELHVPRGSSSASRSAGRWPSRAWSSDWIAESRVRIEQARLLVLKTAWLMDTVGNKGAHTEIQAIKIAMPAMAEWVIDKAIQAHGAAGVSQDTPLAALWAHARTLRLADGPDEVHRRRWPAASCASTGKAASPSAGGQDPLSTRGSALKTAAGVIQRIPRCGRHSTDISRGILSADL